MTFAAEVIKEWLSYEVNVSILESRVMAMVSQREYVLPGSIFSLPSYSLLTGFNRGVMTCKKA